MVLSFYYLSSSLKLKVWWICKQKSFIFCISQNAWIWIVNKQKKIRMKFYFIYLLRLPRYVSERINLMELVYPISQVSRDIYLKHYITKLFSLCGDSVPRRIRSSKSSKLDSYQLPETEMTVKDLHGFEQRLLCLCFGWHIAVFVGF